VKSKIAAVAPEGAIDVTTKDGVVELAGSVPSQEVIDMARLVASNVADVRRVDVSGLMIGN
jgi:osmotically-inducible protein OsmY